MAGLLTPTQAPTAAPASAYTYQSRDATASLADSTGYDATKQNVSDTSLVQNQLKGILSSGSPLLSMAEARADRESNRRGLLNSSIAIGAGQKALYDSALPIAQQDAATFGRKDVDDSAVTNRAKEFTAASKNTASLNNSQMGTQVNLSNATEANRAAAQNAALQTDVSRFNAGAATDLTKLGIQGAQSMQQIAAQGGIQEKLANIQANTQLSVTDKQIAANSALAQADNKVKMDLAKIQADTSLSVAQKQSLTQQIIAERANMTNLAISGNDNQTKMALQALDAGSKLTLANIDAGTKMAIANLDAKTKADLTQLEADNRQLLQTNISASNMYAQYASALANISMNDKMDATAKQQAADNQLAAFNSTLKAIGQVSGLDLSQYFQPAEGKNTGAGTEEGFASGSEAPVVDSPDDVNVPPFDYRRT